MKHLWSNFSDMFSCKGGCVSFENVWLIYIEHQTHNHGTRQICLKYQWSFYLHWLRRCKIKSVLNGKKCMFMQTWLSFVSFSCTQDIFDAKDSGESSEQRPFDRYDETRDRYKCGGAEYTTSLIIVWSVEVRRVPGQNIRMHDICVCVCTQPSR